MTLDRNTLSLAAEYAVASELCRRGIYAQLTLGNLKRTDLLCMSESGEVFRVEVKAKQGKTWPGCKGIYGENAILVFFDFYNKEGDEGPDFYVLNGNDWHTYLCRRKRSYESNRKDGRRLQIRKGIPIFPGEIAKTGKQFTGITVGVDGIAKYISDWRKVSDLIKPA